jgi:hypothetical protein
MRLHAPPQEVVLQAGPGDPSAAPAALYTFALKRKGHLLSWLLHPNTAPVRGGRAPRRCCRALRLVRPGTLKQLLPD